MADDSLIAGAAAPAGKRLIRSASVLDAVWAACLAVALLVVSRVPLIDLDVAYLRSFDPPLRVYVLAAPLVALSVAIVSLVVRSRLLAAIATGVLVPSIALAGSLAGALFLDDASPFTDAGVPLTLAVALGGVIMLVRWFVYSPPPVAGEELQPPPTSAVALLVIGVVLVVNVVVSVVRGDAGWSLSSFVSTVFMLSTPAIVIAAGLVRSVRANVLTAAACVAQIIDVFVVRLDSTDIGFDSEFTLRTGVVGLVGLAAASGVAVIGAVRPQRAPVTPTSQATDDAAWRWSFDA